MTGMLYEAVLGYRVRRPGYIKMTGVESTPPHGISAALPNSNCCTLKAKPVAGTTWLVSVSASYARSAAYGAVPSSTRIPGCQPDWPRAGDDSAEPDPRPLTRR